MKRIFRYVAWILGPLLVIITLANAAQLKEARVTQIVSDVKLLPQQAPPRPAALNDSVRNGTAVRTGTQSRSELTFTDLTITRLGANTIFSFEAGTRAMDLRDGAILFQVPKGSGGATIRTTAVTASITGTTGIGEFHPATASNPHPVIKWFCLEGHIVLSLTNGSGQTVELQAGQMIVTDGTFLPKPLFFDIASLVHSSLFFLGYDTQLASWDLIQAEIQKQLDLKMAAGFIDSTLISYLDPAELTSKIDQAMNAEPSPSPEETPSPTVTPTPTLSPSPTVSPTPSPTVSPTPTVTPPPTATPSKTGTPAAITSSDPYVVDSDTVINTDPSITKNGVTDFGKIYRTPEEDGSRTNWLFGSTSEFDAVSGFEDGSDASFLNNIAAFKFQNLVLDSDPTIVIGEGGATNLALIGINGITTSNLSDELFQFSGIETLLLATQNGSINLGSGYTFSGLSRMFIYARGAGVSLDIGADISTQNDLRLFSEGDVSISGTLSTVNFSSFSNGDFVVSSGGLVAAGGIFVTTLQGDITFNTDSVSAGEFEDISVSLTAGGAVNIQLRDDLSLFESASSLSVSGEQINLLTGEGTVTLNLDVTSPAIFTAGEGGINAAGVDFMTTGGLELRSDGDIDVFGADIPFGEDGRLISGVIDAGGNFHAVVDVTTGDLTAGGSITVDDGDLFVVDATAGTTIDVSGDISAFETVTAGGDITANSIEAPTISTDGDLLIGADGIHPFVVSFGAGDGADVQHTINANSIVSSGGIDFSGNQYGGISELTHGGLLTVNANTILFDAEEGIASANFNGADEGEFDFDGPSNGGDGGTFIVNATGDITLNSSSSIMATTGLLDPDNGFSGVGGSVTLDSSEGMISIDSQILVSSSDSHDTNEPIRVSTDGGDINIHSGLTSGQAITLSENSQLLSLLDEGAPGIGGTINVVSEGGDITADGQIEADRGTIFISNMGFPLRPHGGAMSEIDMDAGSLTASTVEVFSGGDLNIGLSSEVQFDASALTLSAGNILHLGNLMSLQFVTDVAGNVSLSAGTIIVDDALNIQRTNDGPANGINISLQADGNISVENAIQIVTDTSEGLMVGSGANISMTAGGSLTSAGLNLTVANNSSGSISGMGGNIFVQTGTGLSAASINALVDNSDSGSIGSGGNITFDVGGVLTVSDDTNFLVDNADLGVIGGDVAVSVTAGDISASDLFALEIGNGISSSKGLDHPLGGGGGAIGGQIDGNATVSLNADTMSASILSESIDNTAGSIGGDATVSFDVTGNVTSTILGFGITNSDGGMGGSAGLIGGRAVISLSAGGSVTTNVLAALIDNTNGGSIGSDATIDFSPSDDVTITTDATLEIDGSDGAESAAININGGTTTAGGTFLAFIDGNGTIGLNSANIHADVLKVGAFGANGVLNIGGGTLSADSTLKLYASGSNGQINFISDVTLSGNSTKIIAADSVTIFNGVVVTVGNIADENPADVYTNHANYSADFGGNGSTTGTFAGSGANQPQPLPSAPPFDESPRPAASHHLPRVNTTSRHTPPSSHANSPHRAGGSTKVGNGNPSHPRIRVGNTDQLLSLLDRGAAGPGGKITVPVTNKPTSPGRPDGSRHANPVRAVNNPRTSLYPANRSP